MYGEPPVLIALLVCDHVIVERETNKHSLIGTFNCFRFPRFPATTPSFSVYICFTNARGEYDIKLDVINLALDAPIATATTHLSLKDPLSDVELALRFPHVNFPHPGRYEFRLYANGHILGQRTVNVLSVEMPQ